jgi:hypothetical protein
MNIYRFHLMVFDSMGRRYLGLLINNKDIWFNDPNLWPRVFHAATQIQRRLVNEIHR